MLEKSPLAQKQSIKTKDAVSPRSAGFEYKIIYALANSSVISMSTMTGSFTEVIGSTMGAMVSGIAEAMGGKEPSDKVDQEINQGLPEIEAKTIAGISDLRKTIYTQMNQKRQELEQVLSDPAYTPENCLYLLEKLGLLSET